MGIGNLTMTSNENTSYVSADTVYKYLERFVRTFHLNDVIKFNHHVINVKPYDESNWKVSQKVAKLSAPVLICYLSYL